MKMRLTSVLLLAFALAVCAPASASTIYDNGPINGTNGYNIRDDAVADSFVSDGSYTVTGFQAGLWVFTGSTPATVTWTILTGGPSWDGGTPVASGTAPWSNSLWGTNGSYTIYYSTASGLNAVIGAGTYWLELSSSTATGGSIIYWDQNNGSSTAYSNSSPSAIGSEAFAVYGFSNVPVPPSALLLGSGLLGLAGWRRFRKG
jgi:hypothetical protein